MYTVPLFALLTCFVALSQAQQIYIPVTGTSTRPQCAATSALRLPSYSFSTFAFTQNETVRSATSAPAPTAATTYAPPYASLSSLVPSLTTTTWGNWNPNDTAATDTTEPYGNAAFSALWQRASLRGYTTTGIYSTTVAATPVPSSELVLPPPNYFAPTDCYSFPSDFIFGVAGSAAQVEGAIALEGKSPNLLDLLGNNLPTNNFVGNEGYYLYKVDIERVAAMGVEHYSFSIPWTRILPFALPGTPVNKAGIDHYDDLINLVISKGMKPIVTLIHFDTPGQFFGDDPSSGLAQRAFVGFLNGGFQNETFVDAFVNYGKILLTHYGDRVPIWVTFNEPLLFSTNGVSVDHVIKAHAQLYHFYKDTIKGTGKISIKLNDNFGVPRNATSAADIDAATRLNDFQLATFANPIFLGKDYPAAFKDAIHDYIPLTAADLAYINGTADFFAIDPYTATVITPPPEGYTSCYANTSSPLYPYCVTQSTLTQFGWDIGYRSDSYVYTTPRYLRTYLSYLWNTYRSPIVISEFGYPVYGESLRALPDQLFDAPRSDYYLSYMSEVLEAIWVDGVRVLGALAWSYADNWEFGSYEAQFGLQVVERPSQVRRYKKSFFDLVDFVNTRRARLTSLG